MKIPKPPCFRCKHFLGTAPGKCRAFPDRIPESIWSGKLQHVEPFPGDRGIRFDLDVTTEFLRISEVAKILKVNPKTVYRAVWSKKLPSYKVGKVVRIAMKDLEVFKK
jgi:excisionase family DNA binding protein